MNINVICNDLLIIFNNMVKEQEEDEEMRMLKKFLLEVRVHR